MKQARLSDWLFFKMMNTNMKKFKLLIFALFFCFVSFGQLSNCINRKDHPLILEIKDSVKANSNYMSTLAFAALKGEHLALSNSKILTLAYAWASCKKISNPVNRKEKELKFLYKILSDEEFERLALFVGSLNR
jgi:hypothetical protein